MHTYPDAIRKAVRELVNGRVKQAQNTLALAMNTLAQKEDAVAPIPLLTARGLIEKASEMDKTDKEEVRKRLEFAKAQLKLARLLGYLPDDSATYKELKSKIGAIHEEMEGGNKVEKLYEELKASFSNWLDRLPARAQQS